MIAHLKNGSDFGGLFRYLLTPEKKPKIIGGNAAGETINELSKEFAHCADQRQSTKKPVKHIMIGFAPDDGIVTDDVKIEIAEKLTEGLGYTDNQFVVITHDREDPGHDWNHDHDHIHIVINMITIDGQRVDHGWEMYRTQSLLRKLEQEFNLTQVPPSWEASRKCPTHGQIKKYKEQARDYKAGLRTLPPIRPVSEKLQDLIEWATIEPSTMTEYIGLLQQEGVEVKPHILNHHVKGISYRLDGVSFPGYKLGNASFPKLQKMRGVTFDPQKDMKALEEAVAGNQIKLDSTPSIQQRKAEAIATLTTITNDLLATSHSHHLEGKRFKALRQGNELELWQLENPYPRPVVKALFNPTTQTWNDTGEFSPPVSVYQYFQEHLLPLVESRTRSQRKKTQARVLPGIELEL